MVTRRLISYTPYVCSVVALLILFVPAPAFAQTEFVKTIFEFVVNLLGRLAGISAGFLDYSIEQFVVGFGSNVTGSGVGAAVNEMWEVVRDLFNILFIFAIVYLGFKMILGSDEAGTQRNLVTLIIAALLLNFSLLISKTIVDASNLIASEVATSAFPEYVGNSEIPEKGQVQVGAQFFGLMGIADTLKADNKAVKEMANKGEAPWAYIFGSAIVYIIATFAFMAGAIMLLIRFAALCVFMVLSPFMFIGLILPQMKGVMKKYWTQFLGRAFYAPVYILMIYLSVGVIKAAFSSGELRSEIETNVGNVFTDPVGVAGTIGAGLGPFILSAVFLIMSVQVASKLGMDGAGTVMKVGNNATKYGKRFVGGATSGVAASGLRNTVGRGSQNLTNNESFKKIASKSWAGMQAFKLAQTGATSSFDARRVAGVGKSLGVGEGVKGGYAKREKDRVKKEEVLKKALTNKFDKEDPATAIELEKKTLSVRSEQMKKLNELESRATSEDFSTLRKREKIKQTEINTDTTLNEGQKKKKLNALKKETDELRKALNEEEQKLYLQIRKAEADIDDAASIAEGQLKHRNELEYIKDLKKQEEFNKKWVKFVGTGVSSVAAVGAAAAGAPVLAVAGAGLAATSFISGGASQQLAKSAYKAVEKPIGSDGRKGIKNQKKRDQANLFKEVLDENADKKDDDKDDKKEDS